MNKNNSIQSSNFQFSNIILNFTLFLNIIVLSFVASVIENSTSQSDFKIFHLSKTFIYCSRPNWFESINFNIFTNVISANSTQQFTFINISLHFIYYLQSKWSEFNKFQFFISQFKFIVCSLPHWFKFNDFNFIMKTSANSTQPSLSKFNNFFQNFIVRQQFNWFKYNDFQRSSANLLNTLNQILLIETTR